MLRRLLPIGILLYSSALLAETQSLDTALTPASPAERAEAM